MNPRTPAAKAPKLATALTLSLALTAVTLIAITLTATTTAWASSPAEEATGEEAASEAKAADQLTFVHDVAPILHQNCSNCHREGEIAPMSLITYDEVRPWAKSIAKAVQNRDMPPWDADPGFGPFVNDTSLSQDQIGTIVDWVSSGAPKGEGSEPAPNLAERDGDWQLGEPDWVYEFDSIDLPAEGVDEFRLTQIETQWKEDRWIKAIEVLPGDSSVVHHFILWRGGENSTTQDAWLGAWAAGATPNTFPERTARLVPAGRNLIGDFHFHPTGTATSDKTRIGVHFADESEVDKEYINLWVMNASFNIPAGDNNYEANASYVFPEDVKIMSLTPHMHYRGKDMKYTAHYPDGKKRELLSVSRYDFNWQTFYEFEEPLDIPKGTKIEVVAHWDNSAENPHNPDPTRDVGWGTDSTDEMLIGFVDYIVEDGVSPKEETSLVIGKLAELAEKFPAQVWRVDVVRGPDGPEPTAVHLPKDGGQGGWYVQMGTLVLPAPIADVVWDGNNVTARALIPGQEPSPISGTVDPTTGNLDLKMGGGAMVGTPAEEEARKSTQPVG